MKHHRSGKQTAVHSGMTMVSAGRMPMRSMLLTLLCYTAHSADSVGNPAGAPLVQVVQFVMVLPCGLCPHMHHDEFLCGTLVLAAF